MRRDPFDGAAHSATDSVQLTSITDCHCGAKQLELFLFYPTSRCGAQGLSRRTSVLRSSAAAEEPATTPAHPPSQRTVQADHDANSCPSMFGPTVAPEPLGNRQATRRRCLEGASKRRRRGENRASSVIQRSLSVRPGWRAGRIKQLLLKF